MFENAQFQGILGYVCVCWQFSSGSFYKRTDRWQQKWQKIIKNQQRMCLGKCAPESEANKRKWKWNKSGIWNVCFSCKRIQFLMSFGHFSSVTWNLWNFSSIFELCDTHTHAREEKRMIHLYIQIFIHAHTLLGHGRGCGCWCARVKNTWIRSNWLGRELKRFTKMKESGILSFVQIKSHEIINAVRRSVLS